jgi:epoxyqueuosine reductase
MAMTALDSPFVKEQAARAGFDKVGIARAEPLDPGPLDRMLSRGAEADMAWLGETRAQRLDPRRLLPGAESVVALALRYGAGEHPRAPGQVARYARGRDYHTVLKRKLDRLVAALEARDSQCRTYASTDVTPVMEKAWAQRAGLGWVGKNGCLITPEHGSWVLLATVIIDRELAPDSPHPDRCGTCDACIPACPTGAIPEPGLVDARRCISFHTVERRGEIPAGVAERMDGWVFGCDACQTVCPWNQAAPAVADPDLVPRPGQSVLDLDAMLRLSEVEYRRFFYGTSLARARYDGLLRNVILAAGWAGDASRAGAVREHLASPFPGVRAAARWALDKLAPLGLVVGGAAPLGSATGGGAPLGPSLSRAGEG